MPAPARCTCLVGLEYWRSLSCCRATTPAETPRHIALTLPPSALVRLDSIIVISPSLASDEFSGVERAVGRDNWQGSVTSGGGSRDPISKWRNNHYPWSISISISRWPGARAGGREPPCNLLCARVDRFTHYACASVLHGQYIDWTKPSRGLLQAAPTLSLFAHGPALSNRPGIEVG